MKLVDRILVIDDDVELCGLVGEYLAPEGFQVESAADGNRGLEQALARFQQGGTAEFAWFNTAVDDYANFHWDHMRAEEKEVLPLAEKHLTAGDWEAIDAAFTDHSDPLFGAGAEAAYDQLFRRIVNLAPPPIGVGPAR